jgi:hypothetical protein
MKKTAVFLSVFLLGFAVLLTLGVIARAMYDDRHVTKFQPGDANFSTGGPLSPERIAANIESGRWTLGAYEYGVRCRCGFVMYQSPALGRVRLRNLIEPSEDRNFNASQIDKEVPPHLAYLSQGIPAWAKLRLSPERLRDNLGALFVLYEGERIIFVGLQDHLVHEPALTDAGEIYLEEKDARMPHYISEQLGEVTYYRCTTIPFTGLTP